MRELYEHASWRTSLWLLVLGAMSACAHRPEGPPSETPVPSRPVVNEAEGYSFELPLSQDFRPGTGRDNVVVRSSQGVRVRVFPEHFAHPPQPKDCWERLLVQHVPPLAPNRPSSPEGLAEMAGQKGLETGDGRLIFLKPLVRGNECVVLVVEGNAEPARQSAQVVLGSFEVSEPSALVRRHLLVDAGLQLRRMNEPEAALERFETLIASGESNPRTLALAGALAFQQGKEKLPLAIAWLEQVVSLSPDAAFPEAYPPEANALYAETLMHLGLAYAQSGRHFESVERLAEAAVREPDDAIILYNFACGLALAGRADEAFQQLRDAFARDPSLAEHALGDPDLLSLHGDEAWEQIVLSVASGRAIDP